MNCAAAVMYGFHASVNSVAFERVVTFSNVAQPGYPPAAVKCQMLLNMTMNNSQVSAYHMYIR